MLPYEHKVWFERPEKKLRSDKSRMTMQWCNGTSPPYRNYLQFIGVCIMMCWCSNWLISLIYEYSLITHVMKYLPCDHCLQQKMHKGCLLRDISNNNQHKYTRCHFSQMVIALTSGNTTIYVISGYKVSLFC